MKLLFFLLIAVIASASFVQAASDALSLQVIDVLGKKALADESVLEIAPATILIKAVNFDAMLSGKITVVYEGREVVFESAFKESFEKEIVLPKKGGYLIKATAEKLLDVKDERAVSISVRNESILGKRVPSEIIFLVVVGVVITLILLLSTLTRQASGQ